MGLPGRHVGSGELCAIVLVALAVGAPLVGSVGAVSPGATAVPPVGVESGPAADVAGSAATQVDGGQLYVAPESYVNEIDLSFIRANLNDTSDPVDGNLTATDSVTSDEVLVYPITAPGIEGVIRNRTDGGASQTEAFLREEVDYVAENDVDNPSPAFDVTVGLDNPGPNTVAELSLTTENTAFVADFDADTYYLVHRLSAVDDDYFADGDIWNTTFEVTGSTAAGPAGASTTWAYEAPVAQVGLVDGAIEIRNAANQTIGGETNVAPGTQIEIRIQSGGASPFLVPLTTRVRDGNDEGNLDNEFTFTGDFSTRSAGDSFTAVIRRGDREISDQFDGRIIGPPTATITLDDQVVSGAVDTQAITVASVLMDYGSTQNRGGFVALHRGSASGPVVGHSSYLDGGPTENVRIALETTLTGETTLVAVPHLDTDGDQTFEFGEAPHLDTPYTTSDGAPVADSATITGPTPVATATVTPTPTATTTPAPTATTTPTPIATATPAPTATTTPTPIATATPTVTATPTATGAATTEPEASPDDGTNGEPGTTGSPTGSPSSGDSDASEGGSDAAETTSSGAGPGFGLLSVLVALGVLAFGLRRAH